MIKPVYQLTLHKTYYEKGFFDLGVAVEKHIAGRDGNMNLYLGEDLKFIQGRMSRKSNLNGTPRVFGGKRLRDWFQSNFEVLDKVTVKIESPYTLWIA